MDQSQIEFTEDERHVLEYFRPSAASKWRRGAIFDLSFIIISLVLGALYLVYHDPGVGFVAYALVFWRAWVAFWQRRRYAKVYRSIFSKYEARIGETGRTSASEPKV
jgi:hypothetical protein